MANRRESSESTQSIKNTDTPSVGFYRDSKGYNLISVPDGDNGRITFRQHQLNALQDHSLEEVFGEDSVVHHRLPKYNPSEGEGITIDLSVNLDVLSPSDHARIHNDGMDGDQGKLVDDIDEIYLVTTAEDAGCDEMTGCDESVGNASAD